MKIDKAMLNRWEKYARLYLAEHGYTLEDVKSWSQAWEIAHTLDIPKEAYHVDKTVNDTHIDTALKRIFPNAKFFR